MSVAFEIAGYLEGEGVGTLGGTAPWSIYVGTEPTKPDSVVTIYDTGGTPGNPDGPHYDQTFQVRVRTHDYLAGYRKAAQIRGILILPTARTIGDWHYTGIWLTTDIMKIGQDDNNRTLFTVNFRLMREPIQ